MAKLPQSGAAGGGRDRRPGQLPPGPPPEPGPVPQVPAGHVRRSQGPGAGHRAALPARCEAGRINHAYLFSGPRGCGKTSSARILARSLNCVQGPTPEPVRGLRLLRRAGAERAGQHRRDRDRRRLPRWRRRCPGPAGARVLRAGVRAVQGLHHRRGPHGHAARASTPCSSWWRSRPPHLKFIFATTEPEKVIATIRSRTHHYPFRLVPPATLRQLLGGHPGQRGGQLRARRAAAGGPGRGGLGAGLAVRARPAAGRVGRGRADLRAGHRPAGLHRRQPCWTRSPRRSPRRRRSRGVPRGRPGGRGRPRAAPVRRRHAGPLPRPDRAQRGAGRGRRPG